MVFKDGVGILGELIFIDNFSWICSCKFCLGVKILFGFCEGMRIWEVKMEVFIVKDYCGECMIFIFYLFRVVLC